MVGNFGRAGKLYYTAIGAEVALAQKLVSHLPLGGVCCTQSIRRPGLEDIVFEPLPVPKGSLRAEENLTIYKATER